MKEVGGTREKEAWTRYENTIMIIMALCFLALVYRNRLFVVLDVLELSMYTRLTLKSDIHLLLPKPSP